MPKTAIVASTAFVAAAFLTGCGTSSEGSRYNAQHGVAQDSQYPKGQPRDSDSPALASTPEISHESPEKMRGPKVEGSEPKSTLREQPATSKEGPKRDKP